MKLLKVAKPVNLSYTINYHVPQNYSIYAVRFSKSHFRTFFVKSSSGSIFLLLHILAYFWKICNIVPQNHGPGEVKGCLENSSNFKGTVFPKGRDP